MAHQESEDAKTLPVKSFCLLELFLGNSVAQSVQESCSQSLGGQGLPLQQPQVGCPQGTKDAAAAAAATAAASTTAAAAASPTAAATAAAKGAETDALLAQAAQYACKASSTGNA